MPAGVSKFLTNSLTRTTKSGFHSLRATGYQEWLPQTKGELALFVQKRYCATRQPTSTRRCLTAGSPAAPTRKDAARHGRSAGWPSHSARRSRDSDPSSSDRPAQVAFARCASSRSRTAPSEFSFNGGTFAGGQGGGAPSKFIQNPFAAQPRRRPRGKRCHL